MHQLPHLHSRVEYQPGVPPLVELGHDLPIQFDQLRIIGRHGACSRINLAHEFKASCQQQRFSSEASDEHKNLVFPAD